MNYLIFFSFIENKYTILDIMYMYIEIALYYLLTITNYVTWIE